MAAPSSERFGVIVHTEALRTSTSGNPRFRVTFADGACFTTEHDIADAHGLTNPELSAPNRVVFTVKGGQIQTVKPSPEIIDSPTYGRVPSRLAHALREHQVTESEWDAVLDERKLGRAVALGEVEPRDWVWLYKDTLRGHIPGREKADA